VEYEVHETLTGGVLGLELGLEKEGNSMITKQSLNKRETCGM
tara:strand:- start:1692 stop:1817 length:126 start_codon:yes stop_codon:yes gene_type:complete